MTAPDQLSQALVVGASRYQHLSALPPTRDVPGMRDVLTSPEYCGYPPENVKVLDEEAATRKNIIAALDAMCERAAPGSRTFFYFSGHGGRGADGSSYIVPVDARKGEYASSAISARDLSRRLDRCAGELTVVLDCCRAAGMAAPSGRRARTGAPDRPAARPAAELAPFTDSLRDDLQSRGRVIFAASPPDGSSWASPDAPYGIFTGHLLDGLRGAASTDGRDVTVYQLFDYVTQRVKLSSGNAQQPVFIANIQAFYSLTRYPRPVQPNEIFEKDVYISYDHGDPVLREWVGKVFRPELERQGVGLSIWDYDELGGLQLKIEEAIVKSRYVVLLLTQSYLKQQLEELTTTMAILQALNTGTRRFIPIQREALHLPLYIQAFVGIDLTPQHEMEFRDNMDRLIRRLKKPPHER